MGKKAKIAALTVMMAAVISIIFLILKNRRADTPGIIHEKQRITQNDYWNSQNSPGGFNSGAAGSYFSGDVANSHTLDFFSYLQGRFRDMEYDDHMKAVREYLHGTIRPPEKAEEMYELYGRYNEYQKELYLDRKRWASGGTPEEMLEKLHDMQEFRRQHFGDDTADAIFGVEVKSSEYTLRKQIVIGDAGLSGSEKEERLALLRREMWGDQADTIDANLSPTDRYEEKLKIHQAELAAMNEEEREEKIREFRRGSFTPEEAARMDNADRQLKYLKDRDREYSRLSRAILDDNGLSDREKNRKIRELHDRLYGGTGKTSGGTD